MKIDKNPDIGIVVKTTIDRKKKLRDFWSLFSFLSFQSISPKSLINRYLAFLDGSVKSSDIWLVTLCLFWFCLGLGLGLGLGWDLIFFLHFFPYPKWITIMSATAHKLSLLHFTAAAVAAGGRAEVFPPLPLCCFWKPSH